MPDRNDGLREGDWTTIRQVLARHAAVQAAKLFGSRAKGTHRHGSDIDLALLGPVEREQLLEISEELNERTLLPYRFDVVAYDTLDSPALRAHIDRVGILIHVREKGFPA